MGYSENVFINCPFDARYQPLFQAIVFAVHDCGFVARCAMETDDGSQIRIDKIFSIIRDCRLGVHDISRTEADAGSGLPRFNMPLELGVFLGAKHFGPGKQREKCCLILDSEPYRYQQYLSDIAGQDIRAHALEPEVAIRRVRDWLGTSASGDELLPGARRMAERHQRFLLDLPALCAPFGLDPAELTFNDYATLVAAWLKANGAVLN